MKKGVSCILWRQKFFQVNMVKRLFVSCVLFVFVSCDRDHIVAKPPGDPSFPPLSESLHPFKSCPQKTVSEEKTDCFYSLPKVKNGELFTGRYKDISNIQQKGVTLGRGIWLCKKGVWTLYQRSLCLTCRPGLDFNNCRTKWDELWKKLNPGE